MQYKMGFIGTGNMGAALAQAAAKSGQSMLLANRTASKAEFLAKELGCRAGTNEEAAAQCTYIFLGVKPQMLPALLETLKEPLGARTDRFVLVSMAAGTTIASIRRMLGFACPIVRIMPNLPAALGKGVVLMAGDDLTTAQEIDELEQLQSADSGFDVDVLVLYDDSVSAGDVAKAVAAQAALGKSVSAQKCVSDRLRAKATLDIRKEGAKC